MLHINASLGKMRPIPNWNSFSSRLGNGFLFPNWSKVKFGHVNGVVWLHSFCTCTWRICIATFLHTCKRVSFQAEQQATLNFLKLLLESSKTTTVTTTVLSRRCFDWSVTCQTVDMKSSFRTIWLGMEKKSACKCVCCVSGLVEGRHCHFTFVLLEMKSGELVCKIKTTNSVSLLCCREQWQPYKYHCWRVCG